MSQLKIDIDNKTKIVSIWLTKEESANNELRESLKPLYKKYKAQKYIVAVFSSGVGDLTEYTAALLKYNKYELFKDDSA